MKKVCSHLNKTFQPLVQRDEIFNKAAPALFAAEFAKMSKEHIEQVKAIQAVIPARKTSFFRGPPQKQGGYYRGSHRGRGRETSGPIDMVEGDQVSKSGTFLKDRTKDPRDYHRVEKLIVDVDYSVSVNQSVKCMIVNLGVVPIEAVHGVAGRLANHVKNWATITKYRWILDTVKGYKINFVTVPYQSRWPHAPHYTLEQNNLIEEEVRDLLQKGAVARLVEAQNKEGFYSNLFLVPQKDGGQRPVINLKAVNKFVHQEHFKMEGIHTLKDLIKTGDWMAKVDLKDAYFMIPIHTTQRKYLRFVVVGSIYEFNCLPFGPSSAPWVFTNTLKPVAALLREMGVRLVVYIDDILILAESRQRVHEQAQALVYLLECLGFIINSKKSVLTLAQIIDFLGVTVDTVLMQLKLPGEKIKNICAEAWNLQREAVVSARALSRLIGKMNATSQVIPPAPLFYRHHLQMILTQALEQSFQNYDTCIPLSKRCKEELKWWDDHMCKWNGKTLIKREIDMIIESDASLTGWGAACQGQRTVGPWTLQEAQMHINCLELLAATFAVHTFAKARS